MKLLLDTCVILWSVSDSKKLSAQASKILTDSESEILVSAMSCAEIACACERGKIELDRHWKKWFRDFSGLNGWSVMPIDILIIEEAYSLPQPFHADPADRVLVATARVLGASIVTADKKILEYPHVETVW